MLLAVFFTALVSTAIAQEDEVQPQQEDPPPNPAAIVIATPKAGTTVSSIFTITGTATSQCRLANLVFASDNQVSGTIESIPQRSGNSFTYTVNTAKVLTRDGLDPYTLKAGKVEFTVYADDPGCDYDYKSVILTVQYPAAPPTPQAVRKQVDVPDKVEKPSPSPSPLPKPILEAPAVKGSFWDNLDTPWWFLIGSLIGTGLLAGTEYVSRRYRARNQPTLKIKK